MISINKFSPKNLEDSRLCTKSPVVFIIGNEKMTNSILIADLLYYLKECPRKVIFCDKNSKEKVYDKLLYYPVNTENKSKKLKEYFNLQKKIKETNLRDKTSAIILDNISHISDITRTLVMTNRNMQFCILISTDNLNIFTPNMRSSAEYIFISCNLNENRYESLYQKYFFSVINNFNKFSSLMNECSKEPNSYLVINNNKNLFWYQPKHLRDPMKYI